MIKQQVKGNPTEQHLKIGNQYKEDEEELITDLQTQLRQYTTK